MLHSPVPRLATWHGKEAAIRSLSTARAWDSESPWVVEAQQGQSTVGILTQAICFHSRAARASVSLSGLFWEPTWDTGPTIPISQRKELKC